MISMVRKIIEEAYLRTMRECEEFDQRFNETSKYIEQKKKEMENRKWRLLKSR